MDLILAMSLESAQVASRMMVSVLVVTGSVIGGIAVNEDFRDTAYIPVKGDVYTIGYGSTKGVKKGDRITPPRALIRLLDEVENVYADGIKKCITVPLYQHEYDAFLRLAYNIGVPAFCRKANKFPKDDKGRPLPPEPDRLIDVLNAGKYAEACAKISEFNGKYITNEKGQRVKVVLPGLVKRRAEERAVCEGKRKGYPQ